MTNPLLTPIQRFFRENTKLFLVKKAYEYY